MYVHANGRNRTGLGLWLGLGQGRGLGAGPKSSYVYSCCSGTDGIGIAAKTHVRLREQCEECGKVRGTRKAHNCLVKCSTNGRQVE